MHMLIQFQLPITDLRNFKPNERLSLPTWPTPIPKEQFVRSFGGIRKRYRGGLKGWSSEDFYCDASRAICFPFEKRRGSSGCYWQPLFMRLYSDGTAMTKVELGFKPRPASLAASTLVSDLLNLQVRVRGAREDIRLYESGPHISSLYEFGTSTKTGKGFLQGARLVTAEAPSVFVEAIVDRYNLISPRRTPAYYGVPRFAKEITLGPPIQESRLFHWYTRTQFSDISTTVLVASEDFTNEQTFVFKRKLRLYLSRLSAEYSTLRRVLRAMSTGELKPAPFSIQSDSLQLYLFETIKRIGRFEDHLSELAGEEQHVANIAKGVLEAISPGEVDSLMAQIERLSPRPTVRRMVGAVIPQIFIQGDFYMGDQFNNYGNAGVFGKEVRVEGGVNQQQTLNFSQIANELDQVRRHLEGQPKSNLTDSELGIINEVTVGAKAGDQSKLVCALKGAGSLTIQAIKELGLPLLGELIKASIQK
jgi:hypothetical protein